jgi:hypothetical protein
MSAHEDLFRRLQNVTEIEALVGTSEHLHLECKTWSNRENEAQAGVAKTICGFANADGGVLVIGLSTRTSADKYIPDCIDAKVPVSDAVGLRSRIEGLIPEIVEPAVNGVTASAIPESQSSQSGFVVVHVPPTDGPPCRSRKDWQFYQRINSGTYRMEYFQIEDMFGKRRRPVLSLEVEGGEAFRGDERTFGRQKFGRRITIGIENRGRATAKFPSIRLTITPKSSLRLRGLNNTDSYGLPLLWTASGDGVFAFGGGADHVVYPGAVLNVVIIEQISQPSAYTRMPTNEPVMFLEELTIRAELAADEVLGTTEIKTFPREDELF